MFALLATACASDDDADPAPAGSDTVAVADDIATTDVAAPTTDAAAEPADSESADSELDGAEPVVSIQPSPHIGLAAEVTVTADRPVTVDVTASSADHVVEVPRTAVAAVEHVIPLVGMRSESTYVIDVGLVDESGDSVEVSDVAEFTTSALPGWFDEHELTIDADRASPGYTIIEFDTLQVPEGAPSSQYLMAYDNEGEVVWYYTNTGALAAVEPTAAGTFNMVYWPFGIREVDVLGNVVGNWRPLPNGADPDSITNEVALAGIDPDQVDFQGGIGALLGNPGDAEPIGITAPWIELSTVHHEAWPMPNGNVLTLSTTVHELTPEQRATFCPDDPAPFNAISDVAVEYEPDGTVVRTWDLWDAVDIDEHPGGELCVPGGLFAEENARDWNHANSVTYDPDRDAVIVSSRHTNQIVAFDHLDDEGPQTQLRWILGEGATMPFDGEPTYYQHAVEVNDDGSLIIYDNGNFRPGTAADDPENPPYSRAVIYEVDDSSEDPGDWSARQRWEHIDGNADGTPVYTTFIGDADVLANGNVLITHGGIGTPPPDPDPDDPLRLLVREVVQEGESAGDIVWELRSVEGPLYVTYRAERIESFYFGPDWET